MPNSAFLSKWYKLVGASAAWLALSFWSVAGLA